MQKGGRSAAGPTGAPVVFQIHGLERTWAPDTQTYGLGKQVLGTYREFEDASQDL